MHTATQPTEPHGSTVVRQGPVSWDHLDQIRLTHGLERQRLKRKTLTPEVRLLHEVHRAWAKQNPDAGPMPIQLLPRLVRREVEGQGFRVSREQIRTLILAALNDPTSGLRIVASPV